MKKRLLSFSLCLLLAVAMMLSGCSGGTEATTDEATTVEKTTTATDAAATQTTDEEESVFTIALSGEPPSFDPKDFNSTNAALSAYNVYDTLLVFGDDGASLEPCIASEWKMIDDVTYVYTIREDVTFSDGSPLTIDDVVFSLNRIMDPETAASMSYLFNSVESHLRQLTTMSLPFI